MFFQIFPPLTNAGEMAASSQWNTGFFHHALILQEQGRRRAKGGAADDSHGLCQWGTLLARLGEFALNASSGFTADL